MSDVSVECPGCGEPVRPGDEYCASCGAVVTDELKDKLRKLTLREGRKRVREQKASRERKKQVAKAATWILIVAILYAVFGTAFGFMSKSQADDALRVLAQHEDHELFMVEGEVKTVAEWRKAVEAEPRLIFITNYVLAVVMLGLFFWARVQAFPAIVTALFAFLVVQVVAAVIDPVNIYRGIVIKVIVIVVLIAGMKAALAERVAAREGSEAAPGRRTARSRR